MNCRRSGKGCNGCSLSVGHEHLDLHPQTPSTRTAGVFPRTQARRPAMDLILVTNNEREFKHVAGIKIQNWTYYQVEIGANRIDASAPDSSRRQCRPRRHDP